MLKRFFVLTLLLGMSLLGSGMLVGCGQKGPLYLPADSNNPADIASETADTEEGKPAKEAKDENSTTY